MITNFSQQEIRIKKKRLLDVFIFLNFLFLSVDILYAHSINRFSHPAEWLPLIFSLIAAAIIFATTLFQRRIKNLLSWLIGIGSICVGAAGLFFHLDSQFFKAFSYESLIYTAPFIAPLSYTGLGCLLMFNRLISSEGRDWGIAVFFAAYIGFLGNFILVALDHQQNGFYKWTEYVPVVSCAALVSSLPIYITQNRSRFAKLFCHWMVWLQFFIGILGFFLHLSGIIFPHNNDQSLIQKILFGPPLLAPLLMTNLAVLMGIGMKSINHPEKILSIRLAKLSDSEN